MINLKVEIWDREERDWFNDGSIATETYREACAILREEAKERNCLLRIWESDNEG